MLSQSRDQSHLSTYLSQLYRQNMFRYPPTTANDIFASSSASVACHIIIMSSLAPSFFLICHHVQQQLQPLDMLSPILSVQIYFQPIAPAPPQHSAKNSNVIWANVDNLFSSSATFLPHNQEDNTQGRRGVSERATPLSNEVNSMIKSTIIIIKDTDENFQCSHCNKMYWHAKHLKWHLLSHKSASSKRKVYFYATVVTITKTVTRFKFYE